jgi:hypothetical protein
MMVMMVVGLMMVIGQVMVVGLVMVIVRWGSMFRSRSIASTALKVPSEKPELFVRLVVVAWPQVPLLYVA